tara:strand:- start:9521 stop:10486 length:966 start_codon:yes stop_codon:yes gene_type:complete
LTNRQKYIIITILTLAVALFWNKSKIDQDLPGSIGDPLELVVVYNSEDFGVNFSETINELLKTSLGPSPQPESILNLIEIDQKKFTGILKRHQNLLIVSKSDTFSIQIKRDLFATNQFVFFIKCPSIDSLKNNKIRFTNLVQKIKQIEIQRLSTKFASYTNTSIQETIKHTYGISLSLPVDFFLAHSDSSVVWARRETPKISQGVLISKLDQSFSSESEILNLVDSLINPHILGPKNNSYMTIEKNAPVKTETIKVGHKSALKTQSLWRMENDFMGGIFNAYYFNTDSIKTPLLIYTYLYAPGEKKNIPLVQLEAIINTFK